MSAKKPEPLVFELSRAGRGATAQYPAPADVEVPSSFRRRKPAPRRLEYATPHGRVTVEGVNRVTRHTKAGESSRGSRTGGLIVQEASIHVSNVAVVDPSDKKPTGIKTRVETVERDGRQKATRTRVSVRSGKDL